MIKRPLIIPRNLLPLNVDTYPPKFANNTNVYFYDCHQAQPAWLQQLFTVWGIVRDVAFDDDMKEVVYQLYLPKERRSIYVYEKELVSDCRDNQSECPWGEVESTVQDGIMVKVADRLAPDVLLDDVVKALELDAISYMRHKRRIHVLLRTAKSVVRVSYDRQPEYRVFAKRASLSEAKQALMM
ncbi:hypothetical protein [Photobacterium sanguinicancri]|uniref:hypothetical protein n=1 Tax=Photobacterium sanguinicancri TaxID=875932 RepID=UPI0021C428E5|nr:hypothetical protein [Photobacterium sanguinicancri]